MGAHKVCAAPFADRPQPLVPVRAMACEIQLKQPKNLVPEEVAKRASRRTSADAPDEAEAGRMQTSNEALTHSSFETRCRAALLRTRSVVAVKCDTPPV